MTTKPYIHEDIFYVGVNDHKVTLFEGQYMVENGMAYNSYVIMDEKIAIMDTVDHDFQEEWLANVKEILQNKKPDYLIIQHMEPDHSGSISDFMKEYPETTIVSSAKSFEMMQQFFHIDYCEAANTLKVKEGDTLSLGSHTLSFVAAPMVHWPEVLFTYDSYSRVLFSADGFGKFGALDVEEDWACEARRYYFGIVGKYGMQVQAVLKKAAGLDIQTICPLHGPVLTENLGYYLNLYNIWSSYQAEDEGVVIAYASVYGNTKTAALELAKQLEEKGCKKVSLFDLATDDMAEAVEDAFRYSTLVLASITYNNEMFPFMRTFLATLAEHNYQNRTVAFIENGTWAPTSGNAMKKALEGCKSLTFANTKVTIKSTLNDTSKAQLVTLAEELMGTAI